MIDYKRDLYSEIFSLKLLERTGWKQNQIRGRIESDAEHTFSMIMLAFNIFAKNDLELDKMKVLKMITYHELGEIDAGDITPFQKISKQEKFDKEYAGIKRLSLQYNLPEIEMLWLEFERAESKEAKFVKLLDKYDTIKQAEQYAIQENRPSLFKQFYNFNKTSFEEMKKYKK